MQLGGHFRLQSRPLYPVSESGDVLSSRVTIVGSVMGWATCGRERENLCQVESKLFSCREIC